MVDMSCTYSDVCVGGAESDDGPRGEEGCGQCGIERNTGLVSWALII